MTPKCQECGKDLLVLATEINDLSNHLWECPSGCKNALPNYGIKRFVGGYEIKIQLRFSNGHSREITFSNGEIAGHFVADLFNALEDDIRVIAKTAEAVENVLLKAQQKVIKEG